MALSRRIVRGRLPRRIIRGGPFVALPGRIVRGRPRSVRWLWCVAHRCRRATLPRAFCRRFGLAGPGSAASTSAFRTWLAPIDAALEETFLTENFFWPTKARVQATFAEEQRISANHCKCAEHWHSTADPHGSATDT
jgi:hypothetical protein